MRELVLDASIVVKWFHSLGESDLEAALSLYDEYQRGDLVVAASTMLPLELLNFAARRLRLPEASLLAFAQDINRLHIALIQPPLPRIAQWAAQGLTAYDASYVALAEDRGTTVVTADRQMLQVAGNLAISVRQATFSG